MDATSTAVGLAEVNVQLKQMNRLLMAMNEGLYGSDIQSGVFERVRDLEKFRARARYFFISVTTGFLLAIGNHFANLYLEVPPTRAIIQNVTPDVEHRDESDD